MVAELSVNPNESFEVSKNATPVTEVQQSHGIININSSLKNITNCQTESNVNVPCLTADIKNTNVAKKSRKGVSSNFIVRERK